MYTKQQLEVVSLILIKKFPKMNRMDMMNLAADILDALDYLKEK